jgi:type I restriction enzyme S subunit
LSRFRLRAEDIVLGRKGEVDKAALVDEESDGYICGSDSMMLRPAKSMVHPKYLWWFLQSPPAHEQLERFAVGSTVAGLNQRTLRAVQLPVPSLDEQLTVTENLNRATAIIGHAMSIGKQNVKLAKERRAALISATVTGKINVGVAT